mmetsp:Transcript_1782/g.3435  ORF Transcript_1782/g.3435 Transcript_1782/m.3435 type:complete len:709 (+) Transcript_1782:66-2192(+)
MGNKSSSPAEGQSRTMTSRTKLVGKKETTQGRRGRKSTSTEATTQMMSTTSMISEGMELPSNTKFEVTHEPAVMEDDIFDADSSTEDEEESDDEEEEKEFQEAMTERRRVLEDARNLKMLAGYFLHPEQPVQAAPSARCYFDRPSAPERLSYEEAEERAQILQDLKDLKQSAADYMHPELPVRVDAFAYGRNYFSRPSAPEQEDPEQAQEHVQILEDMRALKQFAMDFMHPEVPVKAAMACCRNYFHRFEAPEQEDPEEAEERIRCLQEARALKQLAVDYRHPELPVVTTDATAYGRNYFTRPSAPEQFSEEDAAERERILAECQALRESAVHFQHPELPVQVGGFACGRNYFTRPSAPEQETREEAEERALVLLECQALKEHAVQFRHPELPVEVDGFACGRNYFSRPSALEQESFEEAEERDRVLTDCQALKQQAVAFMHPELPVVTTDPFACGRNYFSRPSAPGQEDVNDAEERALILAEAKTLKQAAVDYMHPELPVVTTDPFACGRNYFSRASAPDQEDWEEAEERARIIAEAKALKQAAVDYLHPEFPVVTTDPCACGRNYFTRPSAPQQTDPDEDEEIIRIIQDAKALKQYAMHYHHPEIPVITTDTCACARNYFSRPSAPGHTHMVHTFAAHEHDEHHDEHHDHVEHWGMDEDVHMFDDLRQQMVVPTQGKVAAGSQEEEGNLSRSPSSVMLFSGESMYD